MKRKIGVIRDERFLEHKTGIIHPEHPNRLKYLYNLIDAEFTRVSEFVEAKPITLMDLERVHTPAYVKRVLHTANLEFTHLAQDTPASHRTYLAAWLAAGACISGLDWLIANKRDICFALVRPPGHHALPDRAAGFCVFNNVGVAAVYAMRVHGFKRILIVDWDVHHGNGIQELFYREERVLYISSHFTNIFPFAGRWEDVGEGPGEGRTVNIELIKGIEDLDLLHIYREVVGEAILRQAPDLIMIAAGFDLHHQDLFSRAKVTENAFGMLTRMILDCKRQIGDPPMLLALEGGYRIPALVKSVREVFNALTEMDAEAKLPLIRTPVAEGLLTVARGFHSKYHVWTD
jgi:acetoin utilization deacetylase AcuC-like enzyme